MKFFEFIKSVYSEADGTGSSTRVHIGLLTSFVIGCGIGFSILVFKHVLSLEQFNSFLASGATFLIGTAGPLYGLNSVKNYFKDKNQNGPNNP